MAHRALSRPEDVVEYADYLDEGWPARHQVMDHICDRLQRLASQPLTVLELCIGPGALCQQILQQVPVSKYVGVDIMPASVEFVQQLTKEFDVETEWYAADLNEDGWQSIVDDEYDVVVALQSIHDLGGEAEVRRIYGNAITLLRDGGLFINADLLRDETDPPEMNPGRFTIPRHGEMLREAGFVACDCTLELDGFGCFEARK